MKRPTSTQQVRDLAKYSQLYLSAMEWKQPAPVKGKKGGVCGYVIDRKNVRVERDLLPTSNRTLKFALHDMLQDRNINPNLAVWDKPYPPDDLAEARAGFHLYTSENEYHFYARVRGPQDRKGYLGANIISRKVLPGESHMRMSDLHDGSLSEETLDEILLQVIACELVRPAPIVGHPKRRR